MRKNTTEEEKSTEKIILNTAKKVFVKFGYNGARMQQIADEAGINKALLHYYFRSKEKLFDAIFEEAFLSFLPNVSNVLLKEIPLEDKIKEIVLHYINMLQNNPYLPVFIAQELQLNPDRIIGIIKKAGLNPEHILGALEMDMKKENIQGIAVSHLLINILGLCVFPFIGRSLIENILFKNHKHSFEKFVEERKTHVSEFIINSLNIYKEKNP